MKILIWVLNIIQFIIVYFLVFSLFFTGVFQVIDPSIGLSGETFWPLMSMGIAGVPWKYYNRFEEAYNTNEKKVLGKSKTKRPGVLYTFFFGYFSLKWRRLIRVLILVTLIILPPLIIINPSKAISDSAIFACLIFTLVLLIPVILISWVVKPFVVKEK